MTKDDIIRMAVQCQLVTTGNRDGVYMDALERFAALVAAKEREACAKVAAEPQGWAMPSFNHAPSDRTIGRIEGEKEMSYRIAAAIRARGNV
jgi:hypothetical protein